MASFYFFTDVDLLQTQNASQAFGPISNTSFRTTSLHQSSSNANAYAVCDGQVFIQQNSQNSNLVNLLIKPKNQGIVNFVNVKYFVYRGILKNTLISTSNSDVIAPANTNNLTEKLWQAQQDLNADEDEANNQQPGTTTDEPSVNAIGYDLSTSKSDSDLVDTAFFDNNSLFKFQFVDAGDKIGIFDSQNIGFEIMIDSIGFHPTFGMIRGQEHLLSAPNLPSNPSTSQLIQHHSNTSQVLNFFDPVAYYGLHFNNKVYAFESTSPDRIKKQGDSISSDLLSKFFNNGKVYLDIRNENNLYFNYCNNYGNDLNLSFSETGGLGQQNFYTSNWPLKIIDSSSFFPSGNKIHLRVAMPEGDNTKPLFYLGEATTNSSYPKALKGSKKFVKSVFSSGFTDEIHLAAPSSSGQSVSWYFKLFYIKRIDANASPANSSVVTTDHHLDNLFFIDDLFSKWDSPPEYITKYVGQVHETFVDAEPFGFACMAKSGISSNGTNIVFYAQPTDFYLSGNTGGSISKEVKSGISKKDSFFRIVEEALSGIKFFKKEIEPTPGQTLQFLKLVNKSNNGVLGGGKENFLCAGLSLLQYSTMSTSATTNLNTSLYPPFLKIENVTQQNGYVEVETKIAGINNSGQYQSYENISCIGENDFVLASTQMLSTENVFLGSGDDFSDVKVDSSIRRLIPNIHQANKKWPLLNEDGTSQFYGALENDTFGNFVTGTPIELATGTRVLLVSNSSISINSIEYYKVVSWYSHDYREGFIEARACDPRLERINRTIPVPLIIQAEDQLESFFNDADFEIKLIQDYQVESGSTSPLYQTLVDNTISLLATVKGNFTPPITPFYLIKYQLLFNSLMINRNDTVTTIQNYRDNPSLDSLINTTGKFYYFPITLSWLRSKPNDYDGYDDPQLRTECDTKWQDFISSSMIGYSGEFVEYSREVSDDGKILLQLIKELKDLMHIKADTSPLPSVVNTPEAQWLLSLPYSDFDEANPDKIEYFIFVFDKTWENRLNSYNESNVIIDQSFGYLDSNTVFSIIIHEANMGTFFSSVFGGDAFDTHSHPSSIRTSEGYDETLARPVWNYVLANSFDALVNLDYEGIRTEILIPNEAEANTKTMVFRGLFRRNPIMGIIYLNHYLNNML